MLRRRSAFALALLLVLALTAVSLPAGSDDETVVFNTQSKKYHCADCRHAQACTKNCKRMTRREAKERGGVACKTCGGVCR